MEVVYNSIPEAASVSIGFGFIGGIQGLILNTAVKVGATTLGLSYSLPFTVAALISAITLPVIIFLHECSEISLKEKNLESWMIWTGVPLTALASASILSLVPTTLLPSLITFSLCGGAFGIHILESMSKVTLAYCGA